MSVDMRLKKLLEESKAVIYGDFTLKSGRKSTYFVNFGKINNGTYIAELAEIYADFIKENLKNGKLPAFDVIFAPAYKGIPLGITIAITLWEKYKINVGFSYNQKEENTFLGADMESSKILLIDDVLTAGTAIKSSWELITKKFLPKQIVAILVGLDRDEGGVANIKQFTGAPVFSILSASGLKVK